MKISDLKPGQKVTINGMLAEYKGIQKVKIPNSVKPRKGSFKVKELIFTNITVLRTVLKRSKARKSS
ncbi:MULTISPECIES: hypothetical protein [Chryseobacterium group]|uniref:hypothetical protein n=1 Tax=Chryseobacterium group TaxID=2782232 RepID=UPI000832067A|nr:MULTISPECIES: hypothetical protein [Chryseobacterium group]